MSIDERTLSWLASPAGRELMAKAAEMPPDPLTRLTRLRKLCSPEIAAGAVALLDLRMRGRAKFAQADAMLFTQEGLEQSTGETIASYRAGHFPEGIPILDACCGMGGDARALAQRAPVLAVDISPANAVCARHNTTLVPTSFPTRTLCADVTRLDLHRLREHGFQAAFFDPSRRNQNAQGERRRAKRAEDYLPPLSWLESLRAALPLTAVKVSPAIDDETLLRYDAVVEFLSDRGECKEAVLWFGALAPESTLRTVGGERYFATVLRPGQAPATLLPAPCPPAPLSAPRDWLYEPDPAVIRAHLVPQVAALLSAARLSPEVPYLTADAKIATPFATAYRILEWMPFQLKAVQARCRALGRKVTAIKKRGVPLEPEALRRQLIGAEAGDRQVVVVLTPCNTKRVALLCEPPTRQEEYVDPR